MKKKSVKLTLWNNILEVISFKELYLLSMLFVIDFAFRVFFFPYRPPFWNCVADNRCELVPRLWFPIPGSTFFSISRSPFSVPRSSLPVHRFPSHLSNFLRYPGYCILKLNMSTWTLRLDCCVTCHRYSLLVLRLANGWFLCDKSNKLS